MAATTTKWGVGCGAVGALLLHLYLADYESRVRGGDMVAVLAVTRDCEAARVLTDEDLEVREIPEMYLEERHILSDDLAKVRGAALAVGVPAGAALLWTDVGGGELLPALADLVLQGMRAVRIADPQLSLGGLLRAGDRVDVIASPSRAALGPSEPSVTLLKGILVLAVDDRVVADGLGEASASPGAVVVSVTPAQGERLAEAAGGARLTLALRNPREGIESLGEPLHGP